jgi:hypothetical protein
MKTASRTLVMSPPEVWEQLDQPGRMQGLMAALLGRATEVDVYEREEESKLAWKADHGEGDAWIEVEIAEKGWGTNVSLTAENGGEPTKLEGWLDAVLEELATPQKRPFEGMTETPADTLAEAASEPAPREPESVDEPPVEGPQVADAPSEEPQVEEAPVEEAQVEEAPVEEAQVGEPPAEPASTTKPRRKKRFGFLPF